MSESRLLTNEEIKELTGYSSPARQCQKLKEAGIFFITRRDGRPSTTWAHIESPLISRAKELRDNQEPNFEAI